MEGHGGGEAPVRAAAAGRRRRRRRRREARSSLEGSACGIIGLGIGCVLWGPYHGGACVGAEHGLLKLNRPKIRIRFGL